MVEAKDREISLEEFLALKPGETGFELIDGKAVAKVAPQYRHARLQIALVLLLTPWAERHGQLGTEWAVSLQRQGRDWVPIPDLLYISFERLAADWNEDRPCPSPPELAIEILSPDQTFGEFVAKAGDYLLAGVDRVWVVDPKNRSLTMFSPDRPPETLTGSRTLHDPLLPGLNFSIDELFIRARLP